MTCNCVQVAETYTKALETINPRKATPNFYRLYVNFAKFYEEGGVAGKAEPDLNSARKILEKATKVNFRTVEDLAEVWCEWAEMEIRAECVNPCLSGAASMLTLRTQELRRGDSCDAASSRSTQKRQDQLP